MKFATLIAAFAALATSTDAYICKTDKAGIAKCSSAWGKTTNSCPNQINVQWYGTDSTCTKKRGRARGIWYRKAGTEVCRVRSSTRSEVVWCTATGLNIWKYTNKGCTNTLTAGGFQNKEHKWGKCTTFNGKTYARITKSKFKHGY